MTVCVAAFAEHEKAPTIVAATDKMFTVGDTTFEGPLGKRFILTDQTQGAPFVVALSAGGSSDDRDICRLARGRILAQGVDSVSGAAECFAEAYREYRRKVFERELLSPTGLDFGEFLKQHQTLSPSFVSWVDRHVQSGYLPISGRTFGCETIITGVDTVSEPSVLDYITPHIYLVQDPGQVVCFDTVGFAAVGSGARQAQSYLMLDGYRPDRRFDHVAYSVYSAKRAAEHNPFVGPGTELIRIDITGMGGSKPSDIQGIEKIYQSKVQRIKDIDKDALQEMAEFMETIRAKAATTPSQTQASTQATPVLEGSIPEEFEKDEPKS
ncbi:MAG: hypothetical protein IIC91_10190 [Chloroflexi bacterium]|nr:hypothetical protein [Chloroflexota bacterium]